MPRAIPLPPPNDLVKTDGGYYAMYQSGARSHTASESSTATLEEVRESPYWVWVVGPPEPGEKDDLGGTPLRPDMLKARLPEVHALRRREVLRRQWRRAHGRVGRVIFVEPEYLTPEPPPTMREWLDDDGELGETRPWALPSLVSILKTWEHVDGINQLLDIDVRYLEMKMPNEKLRDSVEASGKQMTEIKKLYMRLHYGELKYPLSTEQASMIGVIPRPWNWRRRRQLCAARQRLAFAQLTELSLDIHEMISEKHKDITPEQEARSREADAATAQVAEEALAAKDADDVRAAHAAATAALEAARLRSNVATRSAMLLSVVFRSEEQATATGAAPGPDSRRAGGRKKTKKRKKRKTRKKSKRKKRKTRKKRK
jgi:hypothetical protein